jgi:hypothetical protein
MSVKADLFVCLEWIGGGVYFFKIFLTYRWIRLKSSQGVDTGNVQS